jgi:hypothetical protein
MHKYLLVTAFLSWSLWPMHAQNLLKEAQSGPHYLELACMQISLRHL